MWETGEEEKEIKDSLRFSAASNDAWKNKQENRDEDEYEEEEEEEEVEINKFGRIPTFQRVKEGGRIKSFNKALICIRSQEWLISTLDEICPSPFRPPVPPSRSTLLFHPTGRRLDSEGLWRWWMRNLEESLVRMLRNVRESGKILKDSPIIEDA